MERKLAGGRVEAGYVQSGTPEQTFWLGRTLEARRDDVVVPEPRDSIRRPLNLEVLVNHGLTYSTPWHVRDLSLTGAFVEMDASDLPEGSYVEVVLRYRYKGRPKEHRVPATVTRLEERGMALTFGDYGDDTYTDLANLLYAR